MLLQLPVLTKAVSLMLIFFLLEQEKVINRSDDAAYEYMVWVSGMSLN